jgi:hypothetical protein
MLASELRDLLDQVDACEARAQRLVINLDEEGVNRVPSAPGASRWSIAQCLEHLTLMNDFYLRGWHDAVEAAAAAGRGPFNGLRPTAMGRWFVRSMEPPARFKSNAVATVTPPSRIARAGLVDRYRASHEGYRELVRASAAVDVNRVVQPNPIVTRLRMRLATVLLIIPAHDRRHLWQAEQVRRALEAG